MAVIDEFSIKGVATDQANWARSAMISYMWRWFHENGERIIFEYGIWKIKLKVRIRDLEALWIMLFGPEPEEV